MQIRIQRYIALLSVVLFLAKLWAWYLTNSVAILTDALESTVNVITGFIGLYAVLLAAKPRDTNHPYGHGKVEFISSAVEGALISLAGLFIIYEAISQLLYPGEIKELNVGIIITVIAGAINFGFGRYAVMVGKKSRSITVEAAGKHLLSDAYSTMALVAGLVLLLLTGWKWLDSVIAMAFALVIIVTGYRVLRRSLGGIMDEADEELIARVVELLQEKRKVQWIDLHNLRVIQYGEVLHVDAHMTLPWYYRVSDAEREIHSLEDLIREHFGGKVELFIHIDACMPYSCKLCAIENCPVRRETFEGRLVWTLENVWENKKHGELEESVA